MQSTSRLLDDYERFWAGEIRRGDLVREAGTWYDTETDRLAWRFAGLRVEECDQVEVAARRDSTPH
jgi:hypothetical protein